MRYNFVFNFINLTYMSNINLIFYSKTCGTCFKLIQLLEKENFLKYFKLLCIDGRYEMLPPQITAVPTMIVRNINKPLGPNDCFKWIECMVDFRDNKKKDKGEVNINGFSELEFNKFSDLFTFVQTDDPLLQSFHKYKDEENNSIFTAPLENKITNRDQQKRIKELEIIRSQQDNKFKSDMKTEQNDKLARYKK